GAGAPFGQAAPRRVASLLKAVETAARAGAARRIEAGAGLVSGRRSAFEIAASVGIDNEATDQATIVEVSGPDRPGLLAALARALADAGLSIRSAHIDKYGERVVDAFYVRDAKGAKITGPKAQAALRTRLLAVLGEASPAPPPGRTLARARASVAR
ncbi:MAG TPA: ACT domain-containing protein, partial [Caulobacteraceae bacterium]